MGKLQRQIESVYQDYFRNRYLWDMGKTPNSVPEDLLKSLGHHQDLDLASKDQGYIMGFLALAKGAHFSPWNPWDIDAHSLEGLYRAVAKEEQRQNRVLLLDEAWVDSPQLNRELIAKWVKDSGFATTSQLFDQGFGIKLEPLVEDIQQILAGTEGVYRKQLGKAMTRLNLDIANVHLSDMVWLFRGSSFDEFFPEIELVPTMEDTLFKLGINIHKMDNVTVAFREALSHGRRAACYPVLIPQEVYLVAKPKGGYRDYQEIMHAAGHALHSACTQEDLPVPFKRLGDLSVGEGYAFLFEHITREAGWVEEFLDVEPLEAYIELVELERLFNIRLDACRTNRLLNILGQGVKPLDAESVLGVKIPMQLLDLTPPQDLYALRRIRSRMLAAQLRGYILQRLGVSWYLRSETVDVLKEFWKWGTMHNCDELAQMAGYPGLGPKAMLMEM